MPYTFMVIERGIQFLGVFRARREYARRHLRRRNLPPVLRRYVFVILTARFKERAGAVASSPRTRDDECIIT